MNSVQDNESRKVLQYTDITLSSNNAVLRYSYRVII